MLFRSARRGESGLILGNLLGSNLFNSLLVGGAVFVANGARPYEPETVLPPSSLFAMVVLSWGVIVFMTPWLAWVRRASFKGPDGMFSFMALFKGFEGLRGKIDRKEAAVLVAGYAAFVGWLASSFATV